MFCVSCLGIWRRHEIWIPEKLKLDYLKNEKCFQSEIKKHFSLFHKRSLLDIKQTSKSKDDTTFNKHQTTKQIMVLFQTRLGKILIWQKFFGNVRARTLTMIAKHFFPLKKHFIFNSFKNFVTLTVFVFLYLFILTDIDSRVPV